MEKIEVGSLSIEVEHKDIKNIHLSVCPPDGRVRISAPLKYELNTIRVFAISRLGWIKKQQTKILKQERETPREYLDMENHYYNGERYLLNIIKEDRPPKLILQVRTMDVYIRPDSSREKIKEVIEEWYRSQMKKNIPDLIDKWEKILNVKVKKFGIKKMKTKWGTCNGKAGKIWINLELAKKPFRCLDYIVFHEMVHLLEKKHNTVFLSYMDKYMPNWRHIKEELNSLPVKHESWKHD